MPSWTEYLPEGVTNPIVIEIRHPGAWRENRQNDERSRQSAIDLVTDNEYLESRQRLCTELGADHVTVLSVPLQEHWRASEGPPGRSGRQPGPPARDTFVTVWFPPSVTQSEDSATQTVMDWFESSKLGEIYTAVGRANGMSHLGARGSRYQMLSDIAHLKQEADDDGYTHGRGHCACH